ncbi:Protein DOWN-REGULATED IN DIF1 11 [Bienertia sinuspersici]
MVLLTVSCPSKADILEFDIAPDSSLAPDSDIIYAPEPVSDPAVLACASKITLDCATEIVSNDFFAVHFEAKCCKQLVRMGKTCNDLIVDDMLVDFGMKNKSTAMHDRSDDLWNKCLQVLSKC